VSIKTETELDSHVSSVGGISEKALFSCSVGKTDNAATRFLVFAYDKDGVTSFVVFDSAGLRVASKFIEAFHKTDKRKRLNSDNKNRRCYISVLIFGDGLKLFLFNIRYSQSSLLSKKGDRRSLTEDKPSLRGASAPWQSRKGAGLLRRGSQ
jgi:hypothetical protein